MGAGCIDGRGDRVHVVAVNALDVPVVRFEAPAHLLGEGDVGTAFDGDLVVVVQIDELAEAQSAGEGGRLGRDALHEVAVADDAVHVVVHDLVAGPVEVLGQDAFGDGHADAHGEAGAERSGRELDAWGETVFRVSRRLALPLAEALQLFHWQVVSGQREEAVQEHGRVARGEHESVAVGPARVGGIVTQKASPERVGDGRRAHGRAGMA